MYYLKKMRFTVKKITFANIVSLLFLGLILAGIATSIYMNCVNRSLWLDEAMGAFSFSKRSFLQLWNGPLEWLQSAPLGWLYFEKTLTLLFGNTEFVLRCGSILGFVLCLFPLYYLLKRLSVSTALSLAACAFYANMPFILEYSNMFKPYIFDSFIVLLAAFLFQLFLSGRLHPAALGAMWSLLIWFSTPVCFIMGGLLLAAAISYLAEKNIRKLGPLIAIGAAILTSFAVHYIFWLGNEAIVAGMQDFWKGQNFPLIPTSLADLRKMKGMVGEILRHAGSHSRALLVLAVCTFFMAAAKKQTMIIGCYVGILLALFASWLNMFPIEDRMWTFSYGLLVLLTFYGLDCLEKTDTVWGRIVTCLFLGTLFYPQFHSTGALLAFFISFAISGLIRLDTAPTVRHYLSLILAILLVLSVHGIRQYLGKPDAVFRDSEELNSEIEYLKTNIKSGESVYVFFDSVPGFQYKNGYDNACLSGFENNVYFGNKRFNTEAEDEIARVISLDNVYIVSSHIWWNTRLSKLIDAIHENGYLQLVSFEHRTPLWFFCKNNEDSKIHVSYETESIKHIGKTAIVNIRLINDGPAYVNHEFENVYLVNMDTGELYALPKNIKPGTGVELTLSYDAASAPTFRLENEYGLICADSDFIPTPDGIS